jgi:surface antigen
MLKSIAAVGLLAASSMFMTATPALAECHDAKVAGTVGGAIIGGIIGNQFGRGSGRAAATVGGVIVGGLVGREIARDSCRDKRHDAYYYNDSYQDAFESDDEDDDRQYAWENPYSHHRGYVRNTAYLADGWEDHDGPCRRFESRVWVDGDEEYGTGIACRRSNGTWQIVSADD